MKIILEQGVTHIFECDVTEMVKTIIRSRGEQQINEPKEKKMKSSIYEYQLLQYHDGKYGLRWKRLDAGADWFEGGIRYADKKDAYQSALEQIRDDDAGPTVIPWEEV